MSHDSTLEMILNLVGDNGSYQKLLYWVFLVPINLLIPWTALVPIFQTSVPDHWCHVPGKPENLSVQEWKNTTIPRDDEAFSKCFQYSGPDFADERNSSGTITECKNGWEFDTTWYDRTIATDRNWVCQKASHSAMWLSAGVAGNVVGTIIFNSLSDYLGRKLTIVLTTQIYAIFAICRLFMQSDWSLLIMMFLSSLPFPALLQIAYILVLEQVSVDMRAKITSLTCVMWTAGMCSVPLLAWLSRDWVLLGVVTSLPFIPFIIVWWVLPESPRWLVSKGRLAEAERAFDTIGRVNKKKCCVDLSLTLQTLISCSDDLENGAMHSFLKVLDFFKEPVLRKRTLFLVTVYTCNYLTYYILIYNTSNISGNEFLNFFFFSITELPSNLVAWICSQYFGRRYTGVAFFFFSTVLAAASALLVSSAETWIMITVVVTCKAFVNVSYFVIYIQLAELYPTSHRGTGIGIASLTALIIGVSGPYVAYTSSYFLPLPYFILVFIGTLGTVCAFFLPETLGENLPQTLADARTFLVAQPLLTYKGWKPKQRKRIKIDTTNEVKL